MRGGGRKKGGGRRERRGREGEEEQKEVRVYEKVCPMQLFHQRSIVTEKSDIDFDNYGKMEIARTIRKS